MRLWKIMSPVLAGTLLVGMVALSAPSVAIAAPCDETIEIGDAQAVEGSELRFPVRISAPQGCALGGSVRYQTVAFSNGNPLAVAGSDYVAADGSTLSWQLPSGPATLYIPVALLQNLSPELDESFSVRLYDATGATIVHNWAIGTIVDDDPLVMIVPDGPICINIDLRCDFAIELSDAAVAPVTASYATVDGTARAGQDFVGVRDGRVTVPAGATRATFSVRLLPNVAGEPDERFAVVLTGVSPGRIGTGRAEAVIPGSR